MPTTIKSSSKLAKLGDLSTYSITTAAIPYDTADTGGAVPTVSVTMADGADPDYLIDESLTIGNPAIGEYSGQIVDVSSSSNSGRYTLKAETLLSRLNSDQRMYPAAQVGAPPALVPLAALEYWSQQCGIFYDRVEGDVLFYQSQYFHGFAFAKGTAKPIRSTKVTGSGGEDAAYTSGVGTYAIQFGRNSTLTTSLPEPLAVIIPAPTDTKFMVFGSTVSNRGTGRLATITWNFAAPGKQPVALRAVIDSAAGISMQSSSGTGFANLGTISSAVNGDYRLNIGVRAVSATSAAFTLSVIDSAGTVTSASPTTATPGLLLGNLTLRSIVYRGEDQGSGTPMTHRGDYISLMTAMPTQPLTVQKNLTAGTKTATMFSGFSGNVWEKVKEYCSIYQLEISGAGGVLTAGPRQTATSTLSTPGSVTKQLNSRDAARFVEVINRASAATTEPRVLWKADSVYQVAVGEVQEFLVQTEHSILNVSQPVAVSGITPFPYKVGAGQYVVTGSDGYIVSPTFWRDQGGKITADTTGNEGEIKITIKGPDYDSPRAPYRISEGDAGRPALYITGQGIINTPKTLRVGTGNPTAAKEVGVTLDSHFISDVALAYDVAARAAKKFASPNMQASLIEALDYDSPSALGTVPAGQLIKRDGNVFRVVDSTQSPSTVNGTAVQHNTIALVKKSFGAGTTIGQAKAFYGPKTIGQTNIKPLKVVK